MTVEGNYVDSHGQSEIGFGITRLLGFDLLPRIKQINRVRLYRPSAGQPEAYPGLDPALTRPIRWDLIAQQYDQMIKYATAIQQGTASTEAILRRFTRSASHPTYQAMLEVGRAQRTIFVARFLHDRQLQREITEGLKVYINTLLLQDVLAEPAWADLLTDQGRRGLTPLFWQHILPYGEVKLDMTTRLDIRTDPPSSRPQEVPPMG